MAELNYKPDLLAPLYRVPAKPNHRALLQLALLVAGSPKLSGGAEEVLQEMKYQILLGSVSQGSTRVKYHEDKLPGLLLSRQIG